MRPEPCASHIACRPSVRVCLLPHRGRLCAVGRPCRCCLCNSHCFCFSSSRRCAMYFCRSRSALSISFIRSSLVGAHLLLRMRRTASGLILNVSASIGVVKVSGFWACMMRRPSIASRESFRGGDHPFGKCAFMVSRCALNSAGVGSWGGLFDRAAGRFCSFMGSSSSDTRETGVGPAAPQLRHASPVTVE